MAILFFGIGLVTLIIGIGTTLLAVVSSMGLFFIISGVSTIGASLSFFAVYAIIDRLDKLVEAATDHHGSMRLDPR